MDYESLCAYLMTKPGARQDMPFGPDALVYKVMGKIFAILAWQKEPLTISLKADPIDAVILRRQYAAIMPGYHLNKKHWNTVTLDGTVPDDELQLMMDESYDLVVQGLTRAKQKALRAIEEEGHDPTTAG